MKQKVAFALVALMAACLIGCSQEEPKPAATNTTPSQPKSVQNGQKTAKGLDPSSVTLPPGSNGNGNFGSKAGGN